MKAFFRDYKSALIGGTTILCGLLLAGLLCSPAHAWAPHKTASGAPAPDTVKTVRWEGGTDLDMLKQARSDLESATEKDSKIKTLRVALTSPGGNVITSLEIARLVRDTSERTGLIVEFHAEALCASGCTFVLAAGTPGHRFISKWALFLVHPPQSGGSGCIEHVDGPKTQEEKVVDVLLDLMRDSYARYTGHTPAEVEQWITCGNEQVGPGALAVSLNMADATE